MATMTQAERRKGEAQETQRKGNLDSIQNAEAS